MYSNGVVQVGSNQVFIKQQVLHDGSSSDGSSNTPKPRNTHLLLLGETAQNISLYAVKGL